MNIQEHCLEKNFYFDDDTLFNFHCCLQTKPFTILYGPSGTGKSKIAELYADFICSEKGIELKKHLCFVPVRPNWTSPSDLMGFYDYLNGAFIPSEFYDFMKKAEGDSTNPYFLILDEMNLSVVEHYFSDFLACIESRRLNNSIDHDLTNWETKVTDEEPRTASQAAITAFFDLVDKGELSLDKPFDRTILRDHPIMEKWVEDHSKYPNTKDQGFLTVFKSEFNQKVTGGTTPKRLAGKFFTHLGPNQAQLSKTRNYDLGDLSKEIVRSLLKHNRKIEQHSLEIYKLADKPPIMMEIPLNLYIIGTINMDESTHPLSSKVLDRANTIEMNNVSRDILSMQKAQPGALKSEKIDTSFSEVTSLATLNSAKTLNKTSADIVSLIYDINDGLAQYRTNMGHRSIFEITHYINNYIEISGDDTLAKEALDLQFCQKLIPKLMGADERVAKSILHTATTITQGTIHNEDLLTISDMTSFDYPKTLDKLQRMYKYYMENGFVNFANV
jgi:energy-coupling factor transporter ATP-binding protein EcfA2